MSTLINPTLGHSSKSVAIVLQVSTGMIVSIFMAYSLYTLINILLDTMHVSFPKSAYTYVAVCVPIETLFMYASSPLREYTLCAYVRPRMCVSVWGSILLFSFTKQHPRDRVVPSGFIETDVPVVARGKPFGEFCWGFVFPFGGSGCAAVSNSGSPQRCATHEDDAGCLHSSESHRDCVGGDSSALDVH